MGFVTTIAEIMAFLKSKGYHIETGRGRHGVKMVKGKYRIPIPVHGGTLGKGMARKILSDAGYKPDDLMEWRRR